MKSKLDPRSLLRHAVVLSLAGAAHALSACGSDSNVTGTDYSLPDATFGFGGAFVFSAGGASPSGGVFSAGGFAAGGLGAGGLAPLGAGGAGNGGAGSPDASASGGAGPDASGAGDAGGSGPDAGEASACIVSSTPLDTSGLPPCGAAGPTGCTDGKCVPAALVPVDSQALLADCDATNKCVPDIFVRYVNRFIAPTCTSVAGAEGRCLSLCVPQVSAQAGFLPQDTCQDTERCAPCYDPRTGEDTQACRQGCDTGPVAPPKVFAKCCGGQGSCVPTDVVPVADRAQLGTDTCTASGDLCAPDKLSDPTYAPAKCNSLAGLEGRCLADCLPAVQAQGNRLPTDTCAAGERCAPCYDPITGADTQACRRGGDVPADPPTTFAACCGSLGHCVPSSILTADQRTQLGRDTCAAAGDLCAPDVFSAPGQRPEACRALGSFNAEGRCVPACVPAVAAQAGRLDQATCDPGYLCSPCVDPFTGASTGACNQNGDAPVEPPKTFAECCGGQGSCVPGALVPAGDRGQLGRDTCTASGDLCAPDKFSDAAYVPPECNSIAGAEGRCMPSCLPAVAAQASRLPRDTCAAGELCAPCYDPLLGTDTGACTRGTDAPKEPPFTFPLCCGNLGHCVPGNILTAAQRGQLGMDTCTGTGNLCAPDVFAVAGQRPETCRSLGAFDAEGRCVPPCVPAIAAQADRLTRGTCPAGNLCAPCYDPLTGANTSACSQNGDAPTEPAKTFANCCGTLGACVPTTLVPAAQAAQLGRDSCPSAGFLCAPKALTDPAVKPAACRAPGNIEARCLPACLPPIQAQAANLRQQTCATGELCAPCFNPLDGTNTGACGLNGDAPAEPAVRFAGCCAFGGNSRGTCVPPELVSAAQAASLPQDTCATGFLCAPNLKVQDQSARFPTCQLPALSLACTPPIFNLGCQGGCVPSCIVTDPVQLAAIAQGTCAAGELCAPCADPWSGARTGACD